MCGVIVRLRFNEDRLMDDHAQGSFSATQSSLTFDVQAL